MQTLHFGSANFYTLTKPLEVKIGSTTTVAEHVTGEKDETGSVVFITGRARTGERTQKLVRLRPDIVDEIKRLVDGPLNLTVELALRHYAEYLRTIPSGTVVMIKASDLG